MVSAAGASYTYNVQGLRTSKTVGNKTTNFTIVNGKIFSDGTYNYVWGLELITNGKGVYYLYNAHGDVVQLISADEIITYDYDAYGNQLIRLFGSTNPFRYCGEYYDTETGFIYLRARYYDPSNGRFISQDTHWNVKNMIYGDKPDKDNPRPDISAILQSTNLYAYCMNNPVNLLDENGEWALPNWAKVTIGAVATVAAVAVTVATGGAALPVLATVAASTAIGAGVGYMKGGVEGAINGACNGFMTGGLGALGGSIIGGAVRTMSRAKAGITIGKWGEFNKIAEMTNTKWYKGMKEFEFIKKVFGEKVALDIGWWQNKCVVKGVMALKGAIYDCGGQLTGAYAKEVALTKGYEFLYNIWLL